jgi:hypothetical protein
MTHVIGGRASKADRTHTKHHEAEWLTVQEIGKHLNLSVNTVKEMLIKAGYGCKESKKPNSEALRTGYARQFRHHGRKIFKWNRKMVIPEIREMKQAVTSQQEDALV